MHLALGYLSAYARMALTAGLFQILRINARARIRRGKDLMGAVAGRTVGRGHRPALHGQAMIALHVASQDIRGQTIFNIDTLSRMALSAGRGDIGR